MFFAIFIIICMLLTKGKEKKVNDVKCWRRNHSIRLYKCIASLKIRIWYLSPK